MISNYYNKIEDFQRNDIVIPEYEPHHGQTDFLNDMHMTYTSQYIQFVNALDSNIGKDIRVRMEGMPYEAYCQRTTK